MTPKQKREQRERIEARADGLCEIRGPHCTGFGSQIDHIEEKGMGGRHGAAKVRSESDENKRWVCLTCHTERHSGGRVYVA